MELRRRLAIATTALAAAAFASGAYAATQDNRADAPQAFLNDVAKRLHVTPQVLTAALQGALSDQLDEAVAVGRLTQAQAHAIEQRVQRSGDVPFRAFWPGPFGGFAAPAGTGPNILRGSHPVLRAFSSAGGVMGTHMNFESSRRNR